MTRRAILATLFALSLAAKPQVGPARGALVICGGGRLGPEILNEFISLAGGPDSPRLPSWPIGSTAPLPTKPRRPSTGYLPARLMSWSIGLAPGASGPARHSDKVWAWMLGAYGLTVAADADSTRRGLSDPRAREIGIPYRWLSDDAIPPARIVIGAATIYGLSRLHRDSPRVAKVVTGILIGVTGYVAYRNYQLDARLNANPR